VNTSCEAQLQNVIDTFNIKTDIPNTANKYLSKNEQWEILKIYYDPFNKDIDNKNFKITLKFEDKKETDKFLKDAGIGLLGCAREFLKKSDRNPKEYLLSINSIIEPLEDRKHKDYGKIVIIKLIT